MSNGTRDQRRSKRKRIAATIEIVDTMTERIVGQVGNLSATGMMMIATEPLPDDVLFQFRFTLDGAGSIAKTIETGAHQLWSDRANVPGHYWTGFRFIAMAPEDSAYLQAWIEQSEGPWV